MPDMAAGMYIRWELEIYYKIDGNKIIFSVQWQVTYNLWTAADQRGEQSLNKDAKIMGGVRRFSVNNDTVPK